MRTRVHINIPVADLEESVDFYSKVFGCGPAKLKPDYANFRLDIPALHLALVHHPGQAKREIANGMEQHFGVELFDDADLERWKERINAVGFFTHLEENDVTCCYAVADKFWLHDPDGNEWEFWVRHDDDGTSLAPTYVAESCCGESGSC